MGNTCHGRRRNEGLSAYSLTLRRYPTIYKKEPKGDESKATNQSHFSMNENSDFQSKSDRNNNAVGSASSNLLVSPVSTTSLKATNQVPFSPTMDGNLDIAGSSFDAISGTEDTDSPIGDFVTSTAGLFAATTSPKTTTPTAVSDSIQSSPSKASKASPDSQSASSPAFSTVWEQESIEKQSQKTLNMRIHWSQEVGVIPTRKPFFDERIVGSYSCHGLEPVMTSGKQQTVSTRDKNNQDRSCVVFPINVDGPTTTAFNRALFLVLDGHGELGDKVADFAIRQIVVNVDKHPMLVKDVHAALRSAILGAQRALIKSGMKCLVSGSTCVCAYICDDMLYVANVGDSRAVMAVQGKGTYVATMELSEDHKPDLPSERSRIEAAGGFVKEAKDGRPSRVYLDSSFTMMGLATSRSIGDLAVKAIGVVAEPEIKEFKLSKADKFMILASDGVWEFISSEEAVHIVNENLHLGATAACEKLVIAAKDRWEEYEGDYRDDVTATVVTFPLFPM